ncbi:Lrp/AsnC family transcriptional regulator [Confluentibacter sediminis]|uniref:Lrp/AsnC family transcriptional regulator n=1 Tax=Confluentibacter sediminis TaxID=2219045 RepID=UPI000DADC97A|nr:Lrp/AsnC ligand binding domain-containing protein [Confluentibacter sediminis]
MKPKITNIVIDGIDKKILRSLMQDARTPVLEIARLVGISGAAIHQRLKKLEKSGLISGSQCIIDYKVLGYTTLAFVGVYLDKTMSHLDAVKLLKRIPEVLECHFTSGNWSLFIKVISKNNAHLMHILNEDVLTISGVLRTETFVSLDQQIDRQLQI